MAEHPLWTAYQRAPKTCGSTAEAVAATWVKMPAVPLASWHCLMQQLEPQVHNWIALHMPRNITYSMAPGLQTFMTICPNGRHSQVVASVVTDMHKELARHTRRRMFYHSLPCVQHIRVGTPSQRWIPLPHRIQQKLQKTRSLSALAGNMLHHPAKLVDRRRVLNTMQSLLGVVTTDLLPRHTWPRPGSAHLFWKGGTWSVEPPSPRRSYLALSFPASPTWRACYALL
mmetsp:Transcript_79622/g.234159  ORF Transcript_79622/g.234159 Transcript_79622/m.234159 type:complete len:228 (+) Transcript_79622:431-1114(+)